MASSARPLPAPKVFDKCIQSLSLSVAFLPLSHVPFSLSHLTLCPFSAPPPRPPLPRLLLFPLSSSSPNQPILLPNTPSSQPVFCIFFLPTLFHTRVFFQCRPLFPPPPSLYLPRPTQLLLVIVSLFPCSPFTLSLTVSCVKGIERCVCVGGCKGVMRV